MNTESVSVVRIYLTEGEGQMNRLLSRLREKEKVRGVTVFRGISGFGASGVMHVASFTDLSLDLPLVIEFFDEPWKVDKILQHLEPDLDPGHILRWQADVIAD